MKKLVSVILFAVIFFTACGGQTEQKGSSDINNSQNINSTVQNTVSENVTTEVSPSPQVSPEIQQPEHRAVATSPDGTFSVCKGEATEYNSYMQNYYILDNTTQKTINLGDYFYPEIQFIAQDTFTFADTDYHIFNVKGEILFRLSDYFPVGETADGKDNVISSVLRKEDGSLLVMYFDRKEIVTPEKEANNGTLNEPHHYKIAMISPQGEVEKIIDTGKSVESSKSFYVALELELIDENTLACYMPTKSDKRFEIITDLDTGKSVITDYRI